MFFEKDHALKCLAGFLLVTLLGGCAQSFNSPGLNLIATGQFSKAVAFLEPKDLDYDKEPFTRLIYLCEAYVETKRFDRVFACLDAAQRKIDAGQYTADLWNHSAASHRLRAQAYIDLGDYPNAVSSAQRVLDTIKSQELPEYELVRGLGVLGEAYAFNGDISLARQTFAQLDSIKIDFFNSIYSERIFTSKARILFVLKDFEAITKLDWDAQVGSQNTLARAIAGKEVLYFQTLPFRYIEAKSFLKAGKFAEAEKRYANLEAGGLLASFGGIYPFLLHELAFLKSRKGDDKAAIELLKRSITLLEKQRSSILSEASKIGFVGNKQSVYRDLIILLLKTNGLSEAFTYVERSKARALVDMLASRETFAAKDNSADTIALVQQLNKLEAESIQLASLDTAEAQKRGAQLNATKKALLKTSPELASLVTVDALDTASVQARLAADEALLEYYGHEDDLYVFLVTKNAIDAVQLNGANLGNRVQNLRLSVQASRSNKYKSSTAEMYDRLLRPVADKLKGFKQLTIIPHGALHYLPFAALHDGNQYLIDQYDIRLLPSASVLQFLNKKTYPSQELLAFGNPDLGDPKYDLPGAEEEIKVIDQDWKGTRILLRKLASEANFKKFAPSFKYLHLATHGEFNSEEPLKSRILLAPGDGEDGSLTVDELYDLRLNADMVTLSACETGLGDVENGDDVIGLTRGFLYAGAKSIVASLWPVSDEATAYLMKRFYANLKKMPRASALRRALIATKEQFPHPFFWSAFNLTGAT